MSTADTKDFAFHAWVGCREALSAEKERRGLSVRKLAERSGGHYVHVQGVLKGRRRLTVEQLVSLCAALEICPEQTLSAGIRHARGMVG